MGDAIHESDPVRQLLGQLATLGRLPPQQARSMPAGYYTSSEFLQLEREQLFRRQWIGVGHLDEIARAGDFFTTELIGEPLLIVRDAQGGVRALSNVCRHRGHPVARGAGHAQRWVCGYHAWTYGLDGQLLGAPWMQEQAQFDAARCHLPQFRVTSWQGFIFVNLDGEAPPLAQALAPIAPLLQRYHVAERRLLFSAEESWQCNWKCVVENFMEGYHLSPTHRHTLHAVTPTRLCEKLPDGAGFTGYRAHFAPECPPRPPSHPDIGGQDLRSDVFYCVYPSFALGVCPDFTLHMCIRPLSAERTAIRWGIAGADGDPHAKAVTDYVELCRAFCAEDRATLERLQLGLHSRHYTPGPLAPDRFEGTVRDLYGFAARHLTAQASSS